MARKTKVEPGRYLVSAPNEPEFSTNHPGVALSLATTYASRSKAKEMTAYIRTVLGDTVGRVEKRERRRNPRLHARRRVRQMRCFFDGQGCEGEVKLAQGSLGFSVRVTGYCKAHRQGNEQRAKWSGVNSAPRGKNGST